LLRTIHHTGGVSDGSEESGEEDGARAGTGQAKVAGGQKYEVSYEAKKTGKSASAVKKAVKKVGNARKKVEKRLARKK
jgi:Protein of unknown function (DUF3606)